MNAVTLEYPDAWLAAMGTDAQRFARDTKMAAAMKLFEMGRFTSGQAAQFAGVGRLDFLLNCRQWGVDSVQWDDEELASEFATAASFTGMSIVVCNAGPLIALAGIRQLALLRKLFGGVLVASDVRAEVEANGQGRLGADLFQTASWIRVEALSKSVDPLLASLLDLGEAATIALALERNASLVLMDEVKGRRVTRDVYNLPVIGTGRVLVEAKRASLIHAVRPLIDQMRANGYWLADKIVAELLRHANE